MIDGEMIVTLDDVTCMLIVEEDVDYEDGVLLQRELVLMNEEANDEVTK